MTPQQFTDEEKLKEAEREVKQRLFVYKGRVQRGQMTKSLAEKQIALMQSIVLDYRAKTEQPALFRAAPATPAPTVTSERLRARFEQLAGRPIDATDTVFEICEEIETRAKAQPEPGK